MKIIMNDIMFCWIFAWSSAGGGMNIFCCTMNSAIVTSGRMLKYGPSESMPWPLLNEPHPIDAQKPLQSKSMSGAARLEHQRIDGPSSAAPRSSTSTISAR